MSKVWGMTATGVVAKVEPDYSALNSQLNGLEGWRVEVETLDGERRRFIVGRSLGPMVIHLEVKNRRSLGGMPAERRYKTVTKLYRARG